MSVLSSYCSYECYEIQDAHREIISHYFAKVYSLFDKTEQVDSTVKTQIRRKEQGTSDVKGKVERVFGNANWGFYL